MISTRATFQTMPRVIRKKCAWGFHCMCATHCAVNILGDLNAPFYALMSVGMAAIASPTGEMVDVWCRWKAQDQRFLTLPTAGPETLETGRDHKVMGRKTYNGKSWSETRDTSLKWDSPARGQRIPRMRTKLDRGSDHFPSSTL